MTPPSLSVVPDDASDSPTEVVGDVVGSYRLERLLGEGAMGRVFLGRHTRLNRAVAVKVLHAKHIGDRVLVQRFLQEARTVNEINHHHIVEVHDFVEELAPERVYCVMELLEGQTLAERMKAGAMPIAAALKLCRQMAKALGAAHEVGVVHRDVKPDNVFLVTRADRHEYVKVLDFGVAKLVRSLGQASAVDTLTGAVVGTPRYMAPEQAAGLEVDHRADVYSLGTILYEMLAGHPPFQAPTFGQLSADIIARPPPPLPGHTPAGERIPASLKKLVSSCLAKAPEGRPHTMAELVARMPPADPEAAAVQPRRSYRAVAIGAVVVVVGLGGVALLAARQEPAPIAPVPASPPAAETIPSRPPKPPPPQQVTLSFSTSPRGATVKRADTAEVLGKTPLTLTLERRDEGLAVTFELPDHEPAQKLVSQDGNGAFEITLKRLKKAKVVRDGVLDPFGG